MVCTSNMLFLARILFKHQVCPYPYGFTVRLCQLCVEPTTEDRLRRAQVDKLDHVGKVTLK